MKKIFALIITLIYFTMNTSFAINGLYYLKNVQESSVQPLVSSTITSYGYKIQSTNPIYGVNADDYVIVILQQSGQNLFYYYDSISNKKINKTLLKSFKSSGIVYEESTNANIINIYENLAQKVRTQSVNNYVFYDNDGTRNAFQENYNSQTASNSNSFKGYVAQVPKGTKIPVYLKNSINTATTVDGEQIIAVVTNNVSYNNQVVFPQGSVVYGTLTKARHATYGSRNGRVVIDFNKIVTPDNKTYEISTEEIDFTVTNEGKAGRVAGDAVAGALIGGLLGLVVGATTGHVGSSTAIGAGMGAGAAVISGTAERGVDAEIPSFTELGLMLTKPVNVSVGY